MVRVSYRTGTGTSSGIHGPKDDRLPTSLTTSVAHVETQLRFSRQREHSLRKCISLLLVLLAFSTCLLISGLAATCETGDVEQFGQDLAANTDTDSKKPPRTPSTTMTPITRTETTPSKSEVPSGEEGATYSTRSAGSNFWRGNSERHRYTVSNDYGNGIRHATRRYSTTPEAGNYSEVVGTTTTSWLETPKDNVTQDNEMVAGTDVDNSLTNPSTDAVAPTEEQKNGLRSRASGEPPSHLSKSRSWRAPRGAD